MQEAALVPVHALGKSDEHPARATHPSSGAPSRWHYLRRSLGQVAGKGHALVQYQRHAIVRVPGVQTISPAIPMRVRNARLSPVVI